MDQVDHHRSGRDVACGIKCLFRIRGEEDNHVSGRDQWSAHRSRQRHFNIHGLPCIVGFRTEPQEFPPPPFHLSGKELEGTQPHLPRHRRRFMTVDTEAKNLLRGGDPMNRKRFVDLSIAIESGLPSDPPMMIPKIDYIDHAMGAPSMLEFFPGIRQDRFRAASGGRRIPPPRHSQRNPPGRTVPLPSHPGPGKAGSDHRRDPSRVVHERRGPAGLPAQGDGERITAVDVRKELERIHYEIKPWTSFLSRQGRKQPGEKPSISSREPAWTGRAHFSSRKRACALWASMPGAGTGPCRSCQGVPGEG